MKYQNIYELATALHLENPDDFEQRVGKGKRRSGRTTRMLLEACIDSQNRPVAIRGYCSLYSEDLRREAIKFCLIAGIIPSNILFHSLYIYQDHFNSPTLKRDYPR